MLFIIPVKGHPIFLPNNPSQRRLYKQGTNQKKQSHLMQRLKKLVSLYKIFFHFPASKLRTKCELVLLSGDNECEQNGIPSTSQVLRPLITTHSFRRQMQC